MTNETHDVGELRDLVRKLQARVAELEEDSTRIRALETAGVDNWGGYSYAMGILNGDS